MIARCTASALILRSLPAAIEGTDTGRRVIHDQRAEVVGKSLDSKWLYVDAPRGRGWASAQYLETMPSPAAVPIGSPAWPQVPNGYDEIVRIFGKPGNALCSAGRVLLPAPIKLSWANEMVTVVACHKLMEDVFTSTFSEIHRRGKWAALENFGGIHNGRNVRGSDHPSTHSWGISGDFDTLDNPLGATVEKMDDTVVAIFEDHGFMWGFRFKGRKDPMHFQYATGY